ncbi:MAG: 50S ribosomal protein L32 [Parachlamydiales bacterium]
MAVPRNRTSNSRKGMRNAHQAMRAKSIHTCPDCSTPKQPHRACLACGTYRGRAVRTVPSEE